MDRITELRGFRIFLLKQLDGLSIEQLNTIPNAFNNNLIWNVGHMIAVQQGMCYTRSRISPRVPEAITSAYLPGTRPMQPVGEKEAERLKLLLISSIDELEDDYHRKKVFQEYVPSNTIQQTFGFSVVNVNDAINYLLHHDGLHFGYMMAMRHLI